MPGEGVEPSRSVPSLVFETNASAIPPPRLFAGLCNSILLQVCTASLSGIGVLVAYMCFPNEEMITFLWLTCYDLMSKL